jgi:hypothetical protein
MIACGDVICLYMLIPDSKSNTLYCTMYVRCTGLASGASGGKHDVF